MEKGFWLMKSSTGFVGAGFDSVLKAPGRKFIYPVCYFFCGKKVTKKAARKGLHPLFGVVLLFRFSTTVASALYRYS